MTACPRRRPPLRRCLVAAAALAALLVVRSARRAVLRDKAVLALLRRAAGGQATPVLARDDPALPGAYETCPYFGNARPQRLEVEPAWEYYDVLFESGDRFRDLTDGKSCAVVGSSGILRSGAFGGEISAHDTVVRFGLADIADASVAGNRTDILWLNPSAADQLKASAMDEHDVHLVLVSTLIPVHYEKVRALQARAAAAGLGAAVGPLHCGFHRDARAATAGLTGPLPTSGMLSVVWALRFCASVDLYGVWPYATDCGKKKRKKKVPYHYFGKPDPIAVSKTHNFQRELRTFRAMHANAAEAGVDFRLRLPPNAQCDSV